MFAYVYGRLNQLGVEIAGESQLVGYPTQYPSVSMVDWNAGRPNARFWIVRLLKDHFGPGDKLVTTDSGTPYDYALGILTRGAQRKLLLVNKRDRTMSVTIDGASGSEVNYVDQATASTPPGKVRLSADQLNLEGFAVAVVTFPR